MTQAHLNEMRNDGGDFFYPDGIEDALVFHDDHGATFTHPRAEVEAFMCEEVPDRLFSTS